MMIDMLIMTHDNYGSWFGRSKDVTSPTSKETIGDNKDEEEEEEMDLAEDDYFERGVLQYSYIILSLLR
jgi:hypothetical protein